ncbi:MAG: hypothetical protein SGJ09_02580 [Phycisphaerae bacterium]|nr:hypothetical protein [Phycisphaerae bacterium]
MKHISTGTTTYLVATVGLAFGGAANAGVIFSDNFSAENGGTSTLNFGGLTNWAVTSGTIDLIGNGSWDFFPGQDLYLDLDGSTSSGGTIMRTFTLGPGDYTLEFLLGGSMRGDTNIVDVSFGTSVATYTVGSSSALTQRLLSLSLASQQSVSLQFGNRGGDNRGAILDNIVVTSIPGAPAAVVLVLAGLVRRRRRSITH